MSTVKVKRNPIAPKVAGSSRPKASPLRGDRAPSVLSGGYLALVVCVTLAAALVAYYAWLIIPYVQLPADLLMWSETNFVGDIIKIRTGTPLYTPAADSNSLIYTPAVPLLTYAISWLIGMTTSIPAWRAIQLGYAALAALLGTACCLRLHKLAFPDRRPPFQRTWLVFSFLTLLLAVTSPETNRYTHCLHTDALALLVSVFCFWTMLRYVDRPGWRTIALMAICPAIGYLTKQLLIGWAGVMFVLILVHAPRKIGRLAFFTGLGGSGIALAIGTCYLLWGDAFLFWTFEVMGGPRREIGFSFDAFNLSLARSLDHTFRAWPELAIGVVGGWLLLRHCRFRSVGPLWIAWIVLILGEAFSSGAGWATMYHFGPGVVLGTIWLLAALPQLWPTTDPPCEAEIPPLARMARPVLAVAGVFTVFVILQVVPTKDDRASRFYPPRHPTRDVQRYIADIEREFEGAQPEDILLDVGNWIYLRSDYLARDRAVSLGDQPARDMYENFDPLLKRIRGQEYAKILVHDLHSSMFLYDWAGWSRSSGVRRALQSHYTEIRTIAAAAGGTPRIWFSGPVSVLVPKERAGTGGTGR